MGPAAAAGAAVGGTGDGLAGAEVGSGAVELAGAGESVGCGAAVGVNVAVSVGTSVATIVGAAVRSAGIAADCCWVAAGVHATTMRARNNAIDVPMRNRRYAIENMN